MNDSVILRINPGLPVAMIDTSYYIFHRYFATLRWFSFKPEYKAIETEPMCDSAEFLEAYFKHLQQDLQKYSKTFGLEPTSGKRRVPKQKLADDGCTDAPCSPNPFLFLLDCPQGTIWRHRFHDTYKEGRKVSSKLDTRIFGLTYEWLTEKGHRLFRVPELEADDLAYLVKRAIRSVSPLQPMFILTNDNDYIQLCDANCRCFNASLKEIATRGQYGGVANPLAEMRAKILLGDKSDCISACISKKHLEPLLHCDEEALKIQLKPAEYTLYEKNKRLIDLSQIPEELQLRFSAIYSFIV